MSGESFSFNKVTTNEVFKILKRLKINKATGCDNIPSKLLTNGASLLSEPLRCLVNMPIETSVFPDSLKAAEISPSPVYKKGSTVDKKNCRPISVLNYVSKIFEKVIYTNLVVSLSRNFLLSCLDLGKSIVVKYSCVLNFVEKRKVALDCKKVYRAVLTYLSKAFDCLPCRLTISKLHAYRVDVSACMLITNCF